MSEELSSQPSKATRAMKGRGRGTGGRGGHQRNNRGANKGRGRGQKQRPRSLSNQDKIHEHYLAKKSIEGPYAHLYCSQFHGFALSRSIICHQIGDQRSRSNESGILQLLQPYAHKNIDNQKLRIDEGWWDAVKVVRCFAPVNESDSKSNSSSFDRCPICLDEDMTVPYIAPCGHSFCLPCVLGYLNSVAKDLNQESERNKQNTGVASATVTCVRARCPMCSSGSSTVLKAGEAMITYKDLRPLVFVPVMKVNTATKMKFVKLHRRKRCSAPYLPLEGNRVRGSQSTMQQLPDLPDGDDDLEAVTYSRHYYVGLEELSSLLQRQITELNNYQNEPVCKVDPREGWNISMALEAVRASQRRWLNSGVVEGFISVEMSLKLEHQQYLQQSTRFVQSSSTTAERRDESKAKSDIESKSRTSSLLRHGTSHLQCELSESSRGGTDEYAYYQSCDGQLCFISGLDVACLLNEFSLHKSLEQDKATNHDRSKMPLPDEVLATVLAGEEEILTHNLMKRKPFLSHFPLGSTITFVELDWHSGGENGNKPLLSQRTLKKFREELQHRKAERIRVAKKEEKASRVARAKAEKLDRQRRVDMYGSSSLDNFERQQIDPDDEFFQALAVSAAEAEQDTNLAEKFSFNQVCVENGVFPSLSSTLGSSPPKAQTSWGRQHHLSPKKSEDNFPSLSDSISLGTKNMGSKSGASKARVRR